MSNVTPIDKNKKKKPKIIDPMAEEAAAYFIPLGHLENYLYFMTTRGKYVLRFSCASLPNKANLFMLAPLAWWERQYDTDGGFKGEAVDNAVSWVIAMCYDKGAFSPKKVRGRGAWWDEDRAVVHAGDHLIVDGETVELMDLESNYVYEAGPAVLIRMDRQASDAEALKLIKLCRMLHWENPLHGTLLAGWVVMALACGALEWRPHAITTGPSGCGKSWVAKHIVQHVLGEFILSAKGEATSEAGLRQELKHDALAVTFDEAEVEDQRAVESMNKVLGLMRQASAEVEGHILKGGADGTAAKYTIRSAFHLFAIRVPLQQTADENRVTVFTLCKNTPEQKRAFQEEIQPFAAELESDDWAESIRSRVFANIRTLRHNAKIFAKAMSDVFSARIGDQYGPMLGGAWLLGTTEPVTYEKAVAKVTALDQYFDDLRNINNETDEGKLIASLVVQQLKAPGDKRTVDRMIGELIQIQSNKVADEVYPQEADKILQRHGIKVEGDMVTIANRHDGLRKILERTPWGVGWSHILRRIDGAKETTSAVRFLAHRSRGVSVPKEVFI